MSIRLAGEPVTRPYCYPALDAAQTIGAANDSVNSGSANVLFIVRAANKGGSAANLAISDAAGQIDSLQIPAGDTREASYGQGGARYSGQLTVTPSAALDVTVIVL